MPKRIKTIIGILTFLLAFLVSCSPTTAHSGDVYLPGSGDYYGDLWTNLRHSFQFPDATDIPAVQKQLKWFEAHKYYLMKMAKKGGPYFYYIYAQVRKRNLPGEIALIPMIESAYNPFTYSHAGAAGLWQIMPGTGTGFGLKQNWWYDGRRDIYASTKAALDYLEYLDNYFDDDWLLAIAGYDSGEGTVHQSIKRNTKRGKPTDFWHLGLPRETKNYVPKLLALAAVIRNPERYGVVLPPIDSKPYFAQVDVGSQIDLAQAAKLADISLKELYHLNPGYNRWATDPSGPFKLVLPIDKIDAFKANLANLPKEKLVSWKRHKIKQDETLSHLAKQYKTTVRLIREINKLSNNKLRVGQTLLIPEYVYSLDNKMIRRQQRYVAMHQNLFGPKRVLHRVRHGETLWSLARKYGAKPMQIRFWNHLKHHHVLKPGQKLVIWSKKSNPQVTRNPALPGVYFYVVQSGDTLSHIAHHYHVKISELKQWNQGVEAKYLRPGKKLTIYHKA